MIDITARSLERYFNWRYETTALVLSRAVVILAGLSFIVISTVIVAFDSVLPNQQSVASLQVDEVTQQNIYAPENVEYDSVVLTMDARQLAADAVTPVFDPPEVSLARQRTQLAQQILEFIDNVRRDPFADAETKVRDITQIRELTLDEDTLQRIVAVDNDTWREIDDEIVRVLENVMLREEIRDTNIDNVIQILPNQVDLQFTQDNTNVVVAIVEDLIRPNTSINEEATQAAIEDARQSVSDVRRSFTRGQLVVSGGTRITPADYEALQQLGLLTQQSNRLQRIGQAFLASVIVMVVVGLYILRFQPDLIYSSPRFLTLLAAIFLLVLAGARLGLGGQIYIFPTAVLALLYVAISSPQVAIIGTLGLAMLVGVMANSSLEIAALVAAGGIIGALSLKRSERLNSFFLAGLMVAVINIGVTAIFNLGTPAAEQAGEQLLILMSFNVLNGILTAAAAIAGLYIITLLFNLPTALKLAELSQPNQPLLQRLLREAPGTYQHSLQVANLSEQAANAINANAELVHVSALYHDIGKMLNPMFFTENQRDIGNPHDTLNDPYRSADIIISHVTDGDDMARQHRLPTRIRDFIREHHGTSQVFVFYRQAVILAGDDESAVDITEFTYPGPRPRSKETAVLMLADSCEAAVRSRQPKDKTEIEETVRNVIEGKRKSGQLDDSGLTLNDVKIIQDIFIDMLQAIFHPRINYEDAISSVRRATPAESEPAQKSTPKPDDKSALETSEATEKSVERPVNMDLKEALDEDEDDSPMPEVPRLRRVNESGENEPASNGVSGEDKETENQTHD